MANMKQMTAYISKYDRMTNDEHILATRYRKVKLVYERGHVKLIMATMNGLEELRAPLVSALAQLNG